MRIKPIVAVGVTLALAIIVIVVTQALGIWDSDKDNAPEAGADGSYSVEDIKGSLTFSEVEEYYGIPVSALAEAFGVDAAKAADFQCKDVSTIYPEASHVLNNNTVKVFVAFYLGSDVDLGDGSIFLPNAAGTVIEREGSPTEEQRTYLASHMFDPTQTSDTASTASQGDSGQGTGQGTGSGDGGTKPGSGQSATSIELTGGNTFVEVSSDFGIPAEDIMAAFGLSTEQYAFYQLKDLKTLYADSPQTIGPGSVKLFVALYDGYDYDLSVAETYVPQSAVDVLKSHGGLTAEQIAYLDTHVC